MHAHYSHAQSVSVLVSGNMVTLTYHHAAKLSYCHASKLTYHHPAKLTYHYPAKLTYHQPPKLPCCHLLNKPTTTKLC